MKTRVNVQYCKDELLQSRMGNDKMIEHIKNEFAIKLSRGIIKDIELKIIPHPNPEIIQYEEEIVYLTEKEQRRIKDLIMDIKDRLHPHSPEYANLRKIWEIIA